MILSIFRSLLGKLGVHIESHHNDSHSKSDHHITFNIGGIHNNFGMEAFKQYLVSNSPVLPENLNSNMSGTIKLPEDAEASIKPEGRLQMTKKTKSPTKEELALVQLARGNRPYNSIENVLINYDESGNIKSLQWNEN